MKKLWFVLILVLVTGMLFGCGDTTTTTSTATPTTVQEFNKTLTLQGKIMDATTGAAIGGTDLQVFLIQGVVNRTPDKLITDTNSALAGEYAFSGIPIAINTNNVAYKVVVVKNGYQRFEAECLFDANIGGAGSLLDSVYNWIGNIYLFPLGAQAGDVTVYVYNNINRPISGATVQLQQLINTNNPSTQTTGGTSVVPGAAIASTTLNATNGLLSNPTTTTDANGRATFAGSSLTLGGQYMPNALAITFEGQQMASTAGTIFTVGTNSLTQVINMNDATNELFAVSASNQLPGTVTANGQLTITFNQPVSLTSPTFTATLSLASGGTLTNNGASGNAINYTGSVSADGMTLTIGPVTFLTAPTAPGASVTWSTAGTLILRNSQTGSGLSPFQVRNITTNAVVSGTVQVLNF